MGGGSDAPVQGMSKPTINEAHKPFELVGMKGANEAQRLQVNNLLKLKDEARRGTGYNEEHRQILSGLADEAMQLIAKYGSAGNIQGEDRLRFNRALEMLEAVPKLAPKPERGLFRSPEDYKKATTPLIYGMS